MSQTVSALLSLRELILDGTLVAGERVTEIAVAERLGVSRTPLRAALLQLASEGLLDVLDAGGYTVRAFTETDVDDAIELRGMLEGMAARFAAQRGVPAARIATMREILSAIDLLLTDRRDQSAFQTYVSLNEEFHRQLADVAGSPTVAREIARVTALPFASPSAFVMAQSVGRNGWDLLVIAQDQHKAVIEAIIGREGARAEALMREHARVAQRNLHDALSGRGRQKAATMRLVRGGALIGSRTAAIEIEVEHAV